MQSVRKHPGLFAAFSGILIFAWTAILSRSDSHVSVYILCGMAGILALSKNLPDLETCTLQGRAGEYGISLLFSAATVLANYPLFAPMSLLAVFTFCLCFSGGFLVFWNIFLFLSRKTFVQASPPASRPAPVFLIVFAAAALTDLLYLYTAAYPGVLTRDSVTTVQEILQGSYSSTMPFWHTMTVRVFLKTGMRLFGEINRAIAFFHTVQILFLSGCIAYAIVTLYRFSANRIFLVLCCGFFLLMPYHIVYSVTLWKDVPFSAAVLLFTTAFSCLLRKAPSAHFGTWALFILGGIGICLWRTNGWYAFLVSAIAILFLSKGRLRKPVVGMGIVLLLCWILNHPVLTALHVAAADPVELLAVPFQQIARVPHRLSGFHPVPSGGCALSFRSRPAFPQGNPPCGSSAHPAAPKAAASANGSWISPPFLHSTIPRFPLQGDFLPHSIRKISEFCPLCKNCGNSGTWNSRGFHVLFWPSQKGSVSLQSGQVLGLKLSS